jgi:hypothetical protein
MDSPYRVTAHGGAPIGDADSIDGVIALAKGVPPGRYRVELISYDPGTGALRSRRWWAIVKDRDGSIRLYRPKWLE